MSGIFLRLTLGLPYGSIDPFAIFFSNFKKKFCSWEPQMFWLLLFLCLEQTTKTTTNLFSKPVFHDGKTVTPKLRMLSYPITFRNNFCTQGQNTFHTHTLNSCNISFLFCLTGLFGIWFFYGVTCLSSSLNAFQMQYMGSLHALQFLYGEHSFSVSLVIKSTRAYLWSISNNITNNITKNANLHLR